MAGSLTPSMGDMVRVFGRIGLLSFGGPAAQIALMHKELVEDRQWLDQAEFLKALSFCMLLPGPEAMQLATYAGWKKRGVIGGLIGGGLFVIPGAIVITLLALLYLSFGNLPIVQALFLGIKAVVVVIVINALRGLYGRALKTARHRWIAVGAFIALFFFAAPFPLVILVAALIGAWPEPDPPSVENIKSPALWPSLRVILIGGVLWVAPLFALWVMNDRFLLDLVLFFSTLAVVTFGGAYAVLAYMTQEVVVSYGWITTAQMIDALGLAETTPGPLILVTQFVGLLAGAADGGIARGLVAGALTLWVTFVPCFIWIFAGAPLIDWLEGKPRLRAALASVTAAVVGVIASLSLWFALHVFFGIVSDVNIGPMSTVAPALQTINLSAVGLAILAAILLLWRHWPLPVVLVLCALCGGITALV